MCTIMERNEQVERYLWCIDSTIRQNYVLIKAAHLDVDDVYQNLAIRLIHAVERYRPGPRSMKNYIFKQLHYELLNCKSTRARYGLSAAPYDLRNAVVSLDDVERIHEVTA